MPDPEKPRALARRLIYASPWVNLYVDKVQFPNGRILEEHHFIEFENPSVMVIARDDAGRCLMVQVCRYTTGRTEWEFPAGRVEPGEAVLDAAARELLEETGCRAVDAQLLFTYNPLNGISNQVSHIVRCRALPPEQGYDTQEISGVAWVSQAEIWHMLRSGEMQDGFALLSFLLDQHL